MDLVQMPLLKGAVDDGCLGLLWYACLTAIIVKFTNAIAQRGSPPNGIMITDILEQRHPWCTCIPIIRYRSLIRLSIAPIEPRIH